MLERSREMIDPMEYQRLGAGVIQKGMTDVVDNSLT